MYFRVTQFWDISVNTSSRPKRSSSAAVHSVVLKRFGYVLYHYLASRTWNENSCPTCHGDLVCTNRRKLYPMKVTARGQYTTTWWPNADTMATLGTLRWAVLGSSVY